jgi:hypothetical protein
MSLITIVEDWDADLMAYGVYNLICWQFLVLLTKYLYYCQQVKLIWFVKKIEGSNSVVYNNGLVKNCLSSLTWNGHKICIMSDHCLEIYIPVIMCICHVKLM